MWAEAGTFETQTLKRDQIGQDFRESLGWDSGICQVMQVQTGHLPLPVSCVWEGPHRNSGQYSVPADCAG